MPISDLPSYTLPAPTGGWNARDPLKDMTETDAVTLDNMFPDGANVVLRNGFRSHSTGMGSAGVESLFELTLVGGTRQLIAAAGLNLYNATTQGVAATSLASGYLSNRWQGTTFRNRLIVVNGVDTPQQYDGTTLAAATYTGVGLTPTSLINISDYKSRLYLTDTSGNIWYGAVDAFTGALTKLDVLSSLRRGGYPMFSGSWTHEAGVAASQDLFVVVSSEGEVLAYSGSFPGDASWSLYGRYFLPKPLGRRGFANTAGDLLIITEQGVIPMSEVVQTGADTSKEYSKVTDKISKSFRTVAKNTGTSFGWQAMLYDRGPYLLFNIPIASGTQYHQYVLNTETRAWCRFTGMNSNCWCLFNGKPYFGGLDGKVYEADYGFTDNGAAIAAVMKTAFSNIGDDKRVKRVTMARPTIIGDQSVRFVFSIDVDFESRTTTDTITTTGSSGATWDLAEWDLAEWDRSNMYSKEWYAVSGLGRTISAKLSGSFIDAPFSVSSIALIVEPGGML